MATPKHAALDACVVISICLKEPGTSAQAQAELANYAAAGCEFYAPGTIVQEALWVFCNKLNGGQITAAEHALAIQSFVDFMKVVKPPPNGDFSLIARAEQIRGSYGCSRSADGIYLALAEDLASLGPAEILTIDAGIENQAKANAPGVKVYMIV